MHFETPMVTCQTLRFLHHLRILRFHEFRALLARFPVHQALLTSTDVCICTVALFEPSTLVLFAFRIQYQKYPRHPNEEFAEKMESMLIFKFCIEMNVYIGPIANVIYKPAKCGPMQ